MSDKQNFEQAAAQAREKKPPGMSFAQFNARRGVRWIKPPLKVKGKIKDAPEGELQSLDGTKYVHETTGAIRRTTPKIRSKKERRRLRQLAKEQK